ncbi:hypothetical protein LX16_4488 [Stackebrandtia albiflava]|uniref:Uncharacterized protein n=1 Tax=Stackebrandtia albiflava TaxID=406432 RepID=A0A562URM0_9ACTN|nr:hypothetical protein LX16_4488 [Stackebrandtia albiflava]
MCGHLAPAAGCPRCGRGHEPLLDELTRLDHEVGRRHAALAAARRRIDALTAELTALQGHRADVLRRLDRIARSARTPRPVPAPVPVPPPPAAPPAAPPTAPAPPPTPAARPELSPLSAQRVLLMLGGLVSAVAIIGFAVYAWNEFGDVGRAAVLATVTAVLLAAPVPLRMRGLTATAETVAVLGVLAVLCDAVVVRLHVGPAVALPVAAFAVLVVTAVYQPVSRTHAPGFALAPVAVAVLATLHDAGETARSLLPAATALVLVLAAWWFGRGADPSRPRLAMARTVTGTAVVVVLYGVTDQVSAWTGDDTEILTLGLTAAALLVAARALPTPWRPGAEWTAGFAAFALWGLGLLFAAMATAVGVTRAGPAWSAPTGDVPLGGGWQLPVFLVALGLALTLRGPRRFRTAFATVTLVPLPAILPATTPLEWPSVAPLAAGLAVAAAAYALRDRDRRLPAAVTAVAWLVTAAALARGGATTTLIVAAVVLAGGVAIGLRGRRAATVAGAAWGIAAWGGTVTVLTALHLSGVPDGTAVLIGVAAVASAWAVAAWPTAPDAARAARWAVPGLGLATLSAAGPAMRLIQNGELPLAAVIPLAALATAALFVTPLTTGVASAGAPRAGAMVSALVASGGVTIAFAPDWPPTVYVAAGLLTAAVAAVVPGSAGRDLRFAAVALLSGIAAVLTADAATGLLPREWDMAPDWRTPVLLAVLATTGAVLLLSARAGWIIAGLATAAALVAAPAAWQLPWWTVPVCVAVAGVAAALPAAFGHAHWPVWTGAGLSAWALGMTWSYTWTPPLDAIAPAVTLLACLGLSIPARSRSGPTTAVLAGGAVLWLPITGVAAGFALDWPSALTQLTGMTGVAAGLLAAALLRWRGAPELTAVSAMVPVTATGIGLLGIWLTGSAASLGVSTVVSAGAAVLLLPDRAGAIRRAAMTTPGALACLVTVAPVLAATYALPWRWIDSAWSRQPTGTRNGLAPYSWEIPFPLDGYAAGCLTAVAFLLLVAGFARLRTTVVTAWGLAALLIPAAAVVLDLPWPALPVLAVLAAAALAVMAGRPGWHVGHRVAITIVVATVGASGLAGTLAAATTTLAGFGLATVVCGWLSATAATRATRRVGAVLAGGFATVTGVAAGLAAGLPSETAGLAGVAVSVCLLAVSAAMRTGRRFELAAWPPFLAAVVLTADSAWAVTIVLIAQAVALTLLGLRRGRRWLPARVYHVAAGTLALLAYWGLLWNGDVGVIETYLSPLAALALLGGALERRRRPELSSWRGYGAGLAVALLPSLALILVTGETPLRRLLLGAGALAFVLWGVRGRLQAPVVVGGTVVAVVAVRELALLWTLLPSWLPLAIAGALLLVVGATFERRRRNLRRVKEAIAAMR